MPAIDLVESDEHFLLKVDLPGLEKETAVVRDADDDLLGRERRGEDVAVAPPVLQRRDDGVVTDERTCELGRRRRVVALDAEDDDVDGIELGRIGGRRHARSHLPR